MCGVVNFSKVHFYINRCLRTLCILSDRPYLKITTGVCTFREAETEGNKKHCRSSIVYKRVFKYIF